MTDNPSEEEEKKKKFIPWSPYKTVEQFVKASSYLHSDDKNAKFQELRQRFVDLLMDPNFQVMTFVERAELMGVNEGTLKNWWKQVPADYMAEALKVSREKSAAKSMEVDAALFREATAEGGDAKHKELFYRRIEGWEPKTAMELSKGKDKDLDNAAVFQAMKDAMAMLSPEQKAELLGTPKETPVLEVRSESGGVVSEGGEAKGGE